MCSDSISELWSKDVIEPSYRAVSTHTEYHKRNYIKHHDHYLNRMKLYYQKNCEAIKANKKVRCAAAKVIRDAVKAAVKDAPLSE
jgi:hypothetical protein